LELNGTTITGAVVIPRIHSSGDSRSSASEVACQKRSTSAGSSSTRNAQPWLNPALGARSALLSTRSSTARSTGSGE
jgi:hypothetical protein